MPAALDAGVECIKLVLLKRNRDIGRVCLKACEERGFDEACDAPVTGSEITPWKWPQTYLRRVGRYWCALTPLPEYLPHNILQAFISNKENRYDPQESDCGKP
jgi:hypothetical protein